ncbi:MAG: hypothetical protein PW788_07190 [Micavibrio sp.]|nr:hypothetical protein [Micavibrio sp.]
MRRNIIIAVLATMLLSGCASDSSSFDSRTDSTGALVIAALVVGGAVALVAH